METLSIYLHIPFCATRCTYCAFNTYANLNHLIAPIVDAIANEMASVGAQNPYPGVGTVYFGGGTPSLLSPSQLYFLLQCLQRHFHVEATAEITAEANPDDLHPVYLQDLRRAGINRLSIGMQSANALELALFARRHDRDAVIRSVEGARAAGFHNLNLDLIYGIPSQTLGNWKTSLSQAIALDPEHLSLYALDLEPGTALYRWVQQERLPEPDDDLAADMYDFAAMTLASHGYNQYEISNWAKPGYECRHNLQYWRNLPYLGLGPGAHGFAGGMRYATVASPQQYIQAICEANVCYYDFPRTPATDTALKVDQADEIAETLMMSLRLTGEGVQRDLFKQRFGFDILALHGSTLERFARQGLLEIHPNRVRLTERGRLLSNVVFRELI